MSENTTAAAVAPESAPETTQDEVVESVESSEPEVEAKVVDTKPDSKTKQDIKKELKKLKIKYNGKEEDVQFDPNDDDYLTKQFQLAKLGQTKAQEYSKLEKEVETFFKILKENPRAILADPNIGVDLKKFAAEIIEEEIANSKKSPEQLEKEKLEKELKSLKDQQKKEKEEYQQKEFERLQELAYQNYDNQIDEALTSAQIPKNAYTIKKVADYMLLGLQNNVDVSPSDIIPLVQEEIRNDIKEMFGVMPDEVIEQMVGKDVIGRIRKKAVTKAKQVPNTKTLDVGKKSEPKPKPASKQTFKDFFKGL